MKKAIAFLKRFQMGRIIAVFLAGTLLLFSTACGGSNVLAKTSDQIREEVPSTGVNNEYKGGMNDYRDVDARQSTKAADAKAKGLVDNAERNLTNRTGNPAEAVKRAINDAPDSPKEVGRNVKQGADKIGDKIQRNAQEFGENAKTGSENLKENTQNFFKGAKETVEDTADRTKSSARDTVKNAAEKGEDVGRKVQRKADDAGDAVKSKVRQDIDTTKNTLDRVDKAID